MLYLIQISYSRPQTCRIHQTHCCLKSYRFLGRFQLDSLIHNPTGEICIITILSEPPKMCCSSFKLLVTAPNSYITLSQYQPTMSCKNPLESRPWNPGCGMTPAQWHHLESNRIEAYRRKQRRSTFPFSGQQYTPPPTAFASMFNPPAPYGPSQQPAPLNQYSLPAPSNLYQYQRLPLANLSNPNIHPQPSGGSPPRKKNPIVSQSQPINHINSSSADNISLKPDTSKSSNESTTKHSKIWHEGFQFAFHKRLKEGSRYRCCSHRSVADCNIILKVLFNGETIVTGSHGTGCARKNGKKVEALPIESNDAPSKCTNG